MTRRVLAYRQNGDFYVSQEFNGDKEESLQFLGHTPVTVNWNEVVEMFKGKETSLASFMLLVASVTMAYGYDAADIEIADEVPANEEVWLFEDGQLFLYAKYGEVVTECAKKCCNGENIRRAEQVLIDNGIDPDEVQTVLQAVGYALCDTELYTEKESDDAIDYFGNVRWCDDDLAGKLMEMGIQPTKERVSEIRYELENGHHFTDHQIEAGWDAIEAAINDKHYPEDLEEDEE